MAIDEDWVEHPRTKARRRKLQETLDNEMANLPARCTASSDVKLARIGAVIQAMQLEMEYLNGKD